MRTSYAISKNNENVENKLIQGKLRQVLIWRKSTHNILFAQHLN